MGNGYRKNARPRGTDEAEAIQVIHTRALVGRGTPEDLVRHLDQYWSFDGKLLAVYDPAVEYDPMKVYDTGGQFDPINMDDKEFYSYVSSLMREEGRREDD